MDKLKTYPTGGSTCCAADKTMALPRSVLSESPRESIMKIGSDLFEHGDEPAGAVGEFVKPALGQRGGIDQM